MKICLSARIVEQSAPRMPLPDFLRLAGDCGYDGFVNVIEPAREDMPIADLARSNAAYLRQFIPAGGDKEAQP